MLIHEYYYHTYYTVFTMYYLLLPYTTYYKEKQNRGLIKHQTKFKIGTNLYVCICIFVILLHKMWLVYLRVASLLTIVFLLVGSLILHEHYF